MDIVVVVLAILYLCGKDVGIALAITTIIEVLLVDILSIIKKRKK